MKTLLKIVATLIGLAVLAVVAAVVIIPMVFDPNDHKERIAAAVKEQTGRDLAIRDDIGLSVFPWLGVNLGVVELSNAPGFAGDYFARTKKVDARIKLLPLLSRRIEMGTVTLHGLELNLMRSKEGRTNWDDLAHPSEKKQPKGRTGEGPNIAALAIGGLDIEDAALRWTDARAGQKVAISDLSIQTGAIALGQPVDLELGFDVESGEPRVSGRITARAKIEAKLATKIYRLDGLEINAALTGESLPGGNADLTLKANVLADIARETASISDVRVEGFALAATGGLAVKGLLGDAPTFEGTLDIARFDPRKLLGLLAAPAIETTDPKVLSALSATVTVGGTPGQIALKPVEITLDDTRLAGSIELARLGSPVPAVRFDLAVDAVDVDRYLPPARTAPPATPGAAATGAAGLPLGTLRALDVDGVLRVGKLKASNLNVTEVALTLQARSGVITLSPAIAKLYEGTYAGTTVVDVRGSEPRLTIDERLSGVQAGPLLKDLQGKEPLTGTANVEIKVTATGATAEAVKKTLSGGARFVFANGALAGVNIARMIREAQARLKGQSLAPEKETVATDFSELTGSIQFKNGIATNDDLLAKSPLLRIEGRGQADLTTEIVDYRVKTTLVATVEGQGGAELADLVGVPIPIKVTGTLKEPKYGLDFEAFASEVAKSKVGEVIGKQKAAAESKVQDAIKEKLGDGKEGGLLKGLLK